MEALEESLHVVLGAGAIFLPVLRYTERKKGKKAKREKEEGKQECLNLRSVIEDFLLLCLSLFSKAGVNLLAGVLHKKKVKSKNTPNNFPPVPVWNCGK